MSPGPRSDHAAAAAIYQAFDAYCEEFLEITRRARTRFARREWRGADADAAERLTLYRRAVDQVVASLPAILGGDRAAWRGMKRRYQALAADRPDAEIAWTFFSSVTRRVFGTVGVDPEVEFTGGDFDHLPTASTGVVHATYPCGGPLAPVVRWILDDLKFGRAYRDLTGDAAAISAAIERHLAATGGAPVDRFEILPTVFYRNTGAYLVGRMRAGRGLVPLVLAFAHTAEGIRTDAALLTADAASIVFGFTHSYFHALCEHPRAVVEFLHTLMPLKRVDELYTSIGYNKHGKTELYRALQRHLAEEPTARFEVAEGDPGLVMTVFALPSFHVAFKVIRDTFGFPKNITRQAVRDRYQFVFVHDRVGRLADAQEFEMLTFPRARFSPAVLDELAREASAAIAITGDKVICRHLYTERLVTPLNLYLRRRPAAAAIDAIVDYGNAIKELAAANIFTGDMLLKNFGVTRHGRVIFYDYDELCLLTDCTFRRMPEARTPEDEMSAEPWFPVAERDVFPEEFRSVLALPGPLGEAFMARHADLLSVAFWQAMQARQREGAVPDVRPYRAEERLPVIFS